MRSAGIRDPSAPPPLDRRARRARLGRRLVGLMPSCTFVLNRQTMSSVISPVGWFAAFSGNGPHRNNPDSQNVANDGPIPTGSYYIVDRKSGGALGPLRDWVLGRDEWFALYRDDGSVDDATFVQSVARGQFSFIRWARGA